VNDALSAIGCSAKAIYAERVGRKPGSFADRVAPIPQRSRPIVVTMANWADKLEVLRRKKHLANTNFSKIGIEEDLTPQQAALKRASWPSFVKAKKDGKKTWWRAHVLFVDGKPMTPTSLPSQTRTDT
jgi:hypothetical protein